MQFEHENRLAEECSCNGIVLALVVAVDVQLFCGKVTLS